MNFFLRIISFVLKRKTVTSIGKLVTGVQLPVTTLAKGRNYNLCKQLYNTYYGDNWIEGCFFLFQHFAAAMAGNAGNWQQQAVMRGGGSGGHRGMSGGGAGFPPHQQQHQGGFHNAPPHMGGMPGGRGQQVG